MLDYENYPIIAAVKTPEDFNLALSSDVQAIFVLSTDILSLEEQVHSAHLHNKQIYIHIDFIDGLSKDSHGVKYLSTKNVDGIISTRSNIVNAAAEYGISSIQRFFMIDSRSVDTALDSLRSSHADMIEILPAIAYKSITKIKEKITIPIIAGGLIEHKDEIFHAINAGASMISTGKHELWNE